MRKKQDNKIWLISLVVIIGVIWFISSQMGAGGQITSLGSGGPLLYPGSNSTVDAGEGGVPLWRSK